MEYIFSTEYIGGISREVVKVISDQGTNLEGKYSIERRYPDNYITDTFDIVQKYRTETNEEKVYDWYQIENHKHMYDKFTPGIIATEQEITDQDLAMIEAEQMLTDLDLRVMELEMA